MNYPVLFMKFLNKINQNSLRSIILIFMVCISLVYINANDNIEPFDNIDSITVSFFNVYEDNKEYSILLDKKEIKRMKSLLSVSKNISMDEVPLMDLTEGRYEVTLVYLSGEKLTLDFSLIDTLYINEKDAYISNNYVGSFLRLLVIKHITCS